MSVIRDCQFYSGWRGWEFGHSINNVALDNVTISRVGMTAIDTQVTNQGDPALTPPGVYAWRNSAGIVAYDAAYITGQGVTIEGYDNSIIALANSNIDINSLWVETANKSMVINSYSVVNIKIKFVIGVAYILNSVSGRNYIENLAYNADQVSYTTQYTKVIEYLDTTSPDTILINLPAKAGDSGFTSIYRTTPAMFPVALSGLWAPVLNFGGVSAGTQANSGEYTRVGNLVFASFYITLPTKGVATGAVTISGLPVAARNDFGHFGSGTVMFAYLSPAVGTLLRVAPGSTIIDILSKTNADFSANADIRGTITYAV
jgi:hypothetical protein